MKLRLLLFLMAAAPALLAAQDPPDGQEGDTLKVEMEAIEVIGTWSDIGAANAPLSFSTLQRDPALLNAESSLSLSEIGRHLPGIWVNNRRNYALGERMTIRGLGWRAAFGVRGIQVILDGIPLTVADGQSMTNIIDPAFVRRAELIRGPAASFWGNSSGGVLYLSTDPAWSAGERFRLRATGGSYGLARGEAQYYVRGGAHSFNIYGSLLDDPGFRNHSSARLWRGGVTGSVTLPGGGLIEYSGALNHMPRAQHPSGLTREQARENPRLAVPSFVESGAGKSITQGQAGLRYLADTPAGALTLSAYGIRRDLENPLPFGIITVGRWSGGLRATLDRRFDRLELKGGAELKLQRDDRVEYENDGGSRGAVQIDQLETVWNRALFASAAYRLGRARLLGSVRFDNLEFTSDASSPSASGERNFYALSPSLGLSVEAGESRLFANLSTSFEAPTTTELVNRPDNQEGFNPGIQPEKTLGLEAGLRGGAGGSAINYELTLYNMWIRDLLFPYQLSADGPVFYRNQGETLHRGVEASLRARVLPRLEASATYTLTDAFFREATTLEGASLADNRVPGVARHRWNAALRWQPGSWTASVSHEFVSRHPVDNRNSSYNDRYHVVDATLSYRLGLGPGEEFFLQPFLNVNNLLDRRYNGSVLVNAFGGRYYEPAAGRNWRFGLSMEF